MASLQNEKQTPALEPWPGLFWQPGQLKTVRGKAAQIHADALSLCLGIHETLLQPIMYEEQTRLRKNKFSIQKI